MTTADLFKTCALAIADSQLIQKQGNKDKEFHFQNWFEKRLQDVNINFDVPGRNSYPDFTLVDSPEGYEIKGLAYPGREATYDSNSQVPKGKYRGRDIYYVFGRYPSKPDGDEYPVVDLVICHGNFLNAESAYEHKNKSAKGFGSYGDIMIRDRKMYVVPTPYSLADGLAHHITLILPQDVALNDESFKVVGQLERKETDEVLTDYTFDLLTNVLSVNKMPNSSAGQIHRFTAYRLKSGPDTPVIMRSLRQIVAELEESVGEDTDAD
ncbi:MAG: hypothetical protein JWQ66_2382 [Mucilaginibacter sp.]|nr:hypothetical protein [Mucilaginibacter sp.]